MTPTALEIAAARVAAALLSSVGHHEASVKGGIRHHLLQFKTRPHSAGKLHLYDHPVLILAGALVEEVLGRPRGHAGVGFITSFNLHLISSGPTRSGALRDFADGIVDF